MSGKRIRILYAVLMIMLGYVGQSNAQTSVKLIENDLSSGILDAPTYAAMLGFAHYAPENLPPKYQSIEQNFEERKCGFGVSAAVREQLPFMRPEDRDILQQYITRISYNVLPESYRTPDGNFLLHYAVSGVHSVPLEDINNNSVPDYIEQVAAVFVNARDILMNDLGFDSHPIDDPNFPEYDIYFKDYGNGEYYGAATPENFEGETATSYIVMDNDFLENYYTKGLDGAKATAVHEYFHAVQMGYVYKGQSEWFLYEASSSWIEEYIYDDINDYIQFVDDVFFDLDEPLDGGFRTRYYGMGIWFKYLFKKYDGVTMMKKMWENFVSTDALTAMDMGINEVTGSSLEAELPGFYKWNYFTGSRADTVNFYTDGKLYPEVPIVNSFISDVDTALSVNVYQKELSGQYVTLTNLQPAKYSMHFETPDNLEDYSGTAFVVTPGGGIAAETEFEMTTVPETLTLSTNRTGSTLVVVSVVTSRLAKTNRTRYSMQMTLSSEIPLPADVSTLMTSIPNPANFSEINEAKIPFVLLEENDVELKIFTASGRLVRTFDKTLYPKGVNELSWDGKDDNYNLVPSGVYIYIIHGPNIKDMKKMAVIR